MATLLSGKCIGEVTLLSSAKSDSKTLSMRSSMVICSPFVTTCKLHNVTAASLFNCWEATFYIAYTASLQLVDNPDNEIRKKVLATDFSDINYVPCIEKFLGCNNLRTWDQHVQAGDVVFFYGNAHIALS